MIKKIVLALCFVGVIGLISGCDENASGGEAPISVSLQERYIDMFGIPITRQYIIITSLVDSVTITNIVVNKGNPKCAKLSNMLAQNMAQYEQYVNGFNKVLAYGDTVGYGASGCDRVLEVKIETDKGDWIFTF